MERESPLEGAWRPWQGFAARWLLAAPNVVGVVHLRDGLKAMLQDFKRSRLRLAMDAGWIDWGVEERSLKVYVAEQT